MINNHQKLKIAWVSPLNLGGNETSSVSAYLSDTLLPLLQDQFEIELFHNSFEAYRDFKTHHFLSAFRRHREKEFDVFFYQLEDKAISNFIRIALGLHPGIVLYHDVYFANDGPEPILNSPWEEIVKKYKEPSHAWPDRSKEYFKEGPFGFRETALSLTAIFSCERDHAEYKRCTKLKLVEEQYSSFYLPYPIDPKTQQKIREADQAKQICFCGSARIEHRAHKVLEALSELNTPCQFAWLLDESEKEQAEALCQEFEIVSYKLLTTRSMSAWRGLLEQSDIAIHTLFSVYGQPGPYLAASLMAGLPCIVSRFGATETLPENVVFKVQPGESEASEIREVLLRLLAESEFPFKATVQNFAWETYDKYNVAQDLARIFHNTQAQVAPQAARWTELEAQAYRLLSKEALQYVPDYKGESLAEDFDVWHKLLEPVFREMGWSANL